MLALVGKPLPSVYSAELSEFVFAAGVKLMERDRPDVMYLSTTDYIQHKHAPGTPVANAFYAMMDRYLAQLDAMGCIIALTADHGMNAKHDAQGSPTSSICRTCSTSGCGKGAARVILPITDPYVVHHGALGSFATAYLPKRRGRRDVLKRLRALPGIEAALTRSEACAPLRAARGPDRRHRRRLDAAQGARHQPRRATTSPGLTEPLRSHGGISEQKVPLVVNRKTDLPVRHGSATSTSSTSRSTTSTEDRP